jgi:D-alanyl-D-alanine carboxypeptidase (penicillin-binding protein 5/6)
MIKLRWLLATVILSAGLAAMSAREKPAAGNKGYAGAIVIDAATGQALVEDNADVANPPASMTKLMTFAVLHDKLASGAITLQTVVQITNEDSKMGGTQVYLDPRETFPVEELIYAMMIQSANDAAHALARAAGGSVEAFVELMNAKARALGMTHTTFRTPHGLPPPSRRIADGDLTTPRDYALLCRYLVLNTDVLKYSSVRNRDFGAGRKQGPQHMKNHNNLLGKVAGVDGLKTGYTEGAGYCLSATAERHGRRVITVIMGSFGPNGQKDLGKTRDLHAADLIERGFATLPVVPSLKTGALENAAAQQPGPGATIKTERPPAAGSEQSSTPADTGFKFRVITPDKKS